MTTRRDPSAGAPVGALVSFLAWRGWRSVAAIVAGFLVASVLVLAIDPVLSIAFATADGPVGALPTTSRRYMAVNLLAGVICGFAGGYVAAWIARRGELLHGAGLAGLMAALSVAFMLNPPPSAPPRWYQVALAIVGPTSACAGAWLRAVRQRSRPR